MKYFECNGHLLINEEPAVGMKLQQKKLSRAKYGMPNDTDRIIVFLKKNGPNCVPPKYVDFRKMTK